MLIRSAAVFKGYYKQPDATRETMTEDGWLRTGDSGFVDRRGHLVIVDRAKDVGKLADGTAVRAAIRREQAQIQPVHRRGGGCLAIAGRLSRRSSRST